MAKIDGLGAHHFELQGHGIYYDIQSQRNIYGGETAIFDAIWRALLAGPGAKQPNKPVHSTVENVLRHLFAEKICAAEEYESFKIAIL